MAQLNFDSGEKVPLALLQPPKSMRLRPVTMSDVEVLLRSCLTDRTLNSVRLLLERATRLYEQGRGIGVVAETADKRVIGYGQLTIWSACGEISDLTVAEAERGRGYGTGIIQRLVQTAVERRVKCIEIGAALSNPRAVALYRRLGFRDERQLFLNLGSGNEPVIYLRLDLGRR